MHSSSVEDPPVFGEPDAARFKAYYEATHVPLAKTLPGLMSCSFAYPEALGPVPAPLERLRNRTRWQVWLRSGDRHALRRVARSLLTADLAGNVRVGLDVDPISAM